MPLVPRVVFEDAHVVVIDKPFGLPSQGTRAPDVAHVHGLMQSTREYVGLHHRLDTPASGLMVLTVARSANAGVAAALRGGHVQRAYAVVVLGDPGASGTWDAPLDGKAARTHWRRVSMAKGMAALEVRLETGRTHQIRRHAVGAGHPVIGDRRHGGAVGPLWPRLALHACRLAFPHPGGGEPLVFESPLPADLIALFERAGATPG
jgi:23S rRNA-/tRNA-specific pseudouridylate synthase